MTTLIQRGDIHMERVSTPGRTGLVYRLGAEGMKVKEVKKEVGDGLFLG